MIVESLLVLAQADAGMSADRWLERGVAGLLALVIAWLLKVNSTDRKDFKEANKEIALGNQVAMKEVSQSIKDSGAKMDSAFDRMEAAFGAVKASIEKADQRATRGQLISTIAIEAMGPQGTGRVTRKQIEDAVDVAMRKMFG